jgi:hypothetical protein
LWRNPPVPWALLTWNLPGDSSGHLLSPSLGYTKKKARWALSCRFSCPPGTW